MLEISELSEKSIKQILTILEEDGKISASLPGGGLIHIEDNLPYLVVYRKRENDAGTQRIIISEASYLLVGNKFFDAYQKLIYALADKLSSDFKSYMVFEIYTGETNNCFTIKAPAKKLPSSVKVLQKELNTINEVFSGLYLKAEIKDTPNRQKQGDEELLSIEDAKKSGAVILGLEIPPVYRDENNEVYPVFLRKFKDYLITCIHKAIFDYVRVQTTSGVGSYLALGRKHLKDKVFEIDKALAKIERSYQFLWLVSPANIHNIKETFFESNYEKVLDYHYRLLPIDPDILKRELYNLKIEEIDDPAMSHIFREKREELDQQITMLSERGTPNFFYNSIRLYKGLSPKLSDEAGKILREVDEVEEDKNAEFIDAKGFSSLARREFDYFAEQDENFKSKVHIRKDVNIMMVSKGELYIPADYRMNKTEATALIQHEVGTHVLTYFNGTQQPLELLSSGLADYDPLQEGLAVMSEFLVNGLTGNRLRTLAGRVIAGSALMEGAEFPQLFRLLKMDYGFTAERAFNITSRIMQGGGFLKDIIYLKGLVQLRDHLQDGGEYEPLLAGKFGLKHTKIIEELTERKVLKTSALRPSYLLTENITNKLNLIREGLPLSQMIT
ncbi:flavohemoglobin expression-modulating QEGLA motif protein [Salegentibacter sp. Hel_I_6]|uniref:flavohemoglobin expression-modulating QEGLA motif protein n=1 Tax=Salegentibacter sp. Hel_I_6 TaxID=1250278 RepID=UPI0005689BBB|nr:tyrosine/phenylalanine carboxypeptidase domain-containing protein [Salegentibacter sp. Hel_I_6]